MEVAGRADADDRVLVAGLVRRFLARMIDTGLCLGVVGVVLLAGADSTDWRTAAVLVGCVLVYEVAALTLWGATLGKLALGPRVLRFPGGFDLTAGRAAGRVGLFHLIGALPCGLGSVILVVTAVNDPSGWRRPWHDRGAGTVVVKKV